MTTSLPYMVSPGPIPKILAKVQEARRPERFTLDFLETILGFTGSSSRPIIPLLKRLGFIASDGVPTKLYDQFRNPDSQKAAMAEGIKHAYKELYDRNQFVHALPREKLNALVTEMTGAEKDNRVAQAIVSTFWTLKDFADFDASPVAPKPTEVKAVAELERETGANGAGKRDLSGTASAVGLNVAYTINLNLPETTDPEVFNAIFRALKANLLESV